jgi:hypothetical protein
VDGNVAWRQSADHPIKFEIEVPAGEAGEPPTWVPKPQPTGGFTAQVPLLDNAPILALVGSPPPGADPGPVQDLALFDFSGVG